MKDARLVNLRLRGDKDRSLSDGAARMLSLIVSDRYLAHDDAESEFPLPWSKVASWTGLTCERDVYRRIRELETASPPYLKRTQLKACFGSISLTNHFVFCFEYGKNAIVESGKNAIVESGKNAIVESGKNAIVESGKNAGHESRRNAGLKSGGNAVRASGKKAGVESGKKAIPLLSNPFGKEIEPEGKNSCSLRSTKERGQSCSLRSTATKGEKSSLPLVGTKAAGARKSADELLAELKKATL